MSSVSTRNKVNEVNSVAIPAGAIVAGACLFALAKGLSFAAKTAIQASKEMKSPNKPQAIRSVSTIRSETKSLEMNFSKTSNLETLKSQAFTQIASQPFLVTDSAKLKSSITALDNAKTIGEFKSTHQVLIEKLENGHQKIFSNAVLDAGKRAALKIGFEKIESLPSLKQSAIRFAATDQLGRTIVTEINAPKDREVRIETEVVGVNDGSCNSILDSFDKALEAEGVRSQTPTRKYTGGVCELSAVRDFLNRKPHKEPKTKSSANSKKNVAADDLIRTRKLNQANQTQKQK